MGILRLSFQVTTFSRHYYPHFCLFSHEETNPKCLSEGFPSEETTELWGRKTHFLTVGPLLFSTAIYCMRGGKSHPSLFSAALILTLFHFISGTLFSCNSSPPTTKPTDSTRPGRSQVLLILPSDLSDVLKCLFMPTARSLEQAHLPPPSLVAQASSRKIREVSQYVTN